MCALILLCLCYFYLIIYRSARRRYRLIASSWPVAARTCLSCSRRTMVASAARRTSSPTSWMAASRRTRSSISSTTPTLDSKLFLLAEGGLRLRSLAKRDTKKMGGSIQLTIVSTTHSTCLYPNHPVLFFYFFLHHTTLSDFDLCLTVSITYSRHSLLSEWK